MPSATRPNFSTFQFKTIGKSPVHSDNSLLNRISSGRVSTRSSHEYDDDDDENDSPKDQAAKDSAFAPVVSDRNAFSSVPPQGPSIPILGGEKQASTTPGSKNDIFGQKFDFSSTRPLSSTTSTTSNDTNPTQAVASCDASTKRAGSLVIGLPPILTQTAMSRTSSMASNSPNHDLTYPSDVVMSTPQSPRRNLPQSIIKAESLKVNLSKPESEVSSSEADNNSMSYPSLQTSSNPSIAMLKEMHLCLTSSIQTLTDISSKAMTSASSELASASERAGRARTLAAESHELAQKASTMLSQCLNIDKASCETAEQANSHVEGSMAILTTLRTEQEKKIAEFKDVLDSFARRIENEEERVRLDLQAKEKEEREKEKREKEEREKEEREKEEREKEEREAQRMERLREVQEKEAKEKAEAQDRARTVSQDAEKQGQDYAAMQPYLYGIPGGPRAIPIPRNVAGLPTATSSANDPTSAAPDLYDIPAPTGGWEHFIRETIETFVQNEIARQGIHKTGDLEDQSRKEEEQSEQDRQRQEASAEQARRTMQAEQEEQKRREENERQKKKEAADEYRRKLILEEEERKQRDAQKKKVAEEREQKLREQLEHKQTQGRHQTGVGEKRTASVVPSTSSTIPNARFPAPNSFAVQQPAQFSLPLPPPTSAIPQTQNIIADRTVFKLTPSASSTIPGVRFPAPNSSTLPRPAQSSLPPAPPPSATPQTPNLIVDRPVPRLTKKERKAQKRKEVLTQQYKQQQSPLTGRVPLGASPPSKSPQNLTTALPPSAVTSQSNPPDPNPRSNSVDMSVHRSPPADTTSMEHMSSPFLDSASTDLGNIPIESPNPNSPEVQASNKRFVVTGSGPTHQSDTKLRGKKKADMNSKPDYDIPVVKKERHDDQMDVTRTLGIPNPSSELHSRPAVASNNARAPSAAHETRCSLPMSSPEAPVSSTSPVLSRTTPASQPQLSSNTNARSDTDGHQQSRRDLSATQVSGNAFEAATGSKTIPAHCDVHKARPTQVIDKAAMPASASQPASKVTSTPANASMSVSQDVDLLAVPMNANALRPLPPQPAPTQAQIRPAPRNEPLASGTATKPPPASLPLPQTHDGARSSSPIAPHDGGWANVHGSATSGHNSQPRRSREFDSYPPLSGPEPEPQPVRRRYDHYSPSPDSSGPEYNLQPRRRAYDHYSPSPNVTDPDSEESPAWIPKSLSPHEDATETQLGRRFSPPRQPRGHSLPHRGRGGRSTSPRNSRPNRVSSSSTQPEFHVGRKRSHPDDDIHHRQGRRNVSENLIHTPYSDFEQQSPAYNDPVVSSFSQPVYYNESTALGSRLSDASEGLNYPRHDRERSFVNKRPSPPSSFRPYKNSPPPKKRQRQITMETDIAPTLLDRMGNSKSGFKNHSLPVRDAPAAGTHGYGFGRGQGQRPGNGTGLLGCMQPQ
ncbi:hypothetical protein F5878DRAFT_453523 [Lentinula raphanica]|uniref:Uncharacterized protein n=1 Tax=Lentinula raphanica TaxID=153919 RepID=A0AA38U564_9AGAR|nr:hypothetical protein F5878DRAFT_453523 [Lentinula raphanica]